MSVSIWKVALSRDESLGNLPVVFLAGPYLRPGLISDLRFAYATLSPGEVWLGPALSELVPSFPGSAADVVGLFGSSERVAVVWQEVERQDPCACSVTPLVRVEIFAQLIEAGESPQAAGNPFSVHLWQEGDPAGPSLTLPQLVASATVPGGFTVLWSDGLLRYATVLPTLFVDGFESGNTSAWSAIVP